MVAGDSAEREQEPNWRLRLWTESLSGLSELRQSCYQPLRSLNRWKRKTSSPSATASFSPSSRSSASFFTHCVKFLFFLILFTFWRPSLCADCGKVSRNGEVIHHRQPPHQPHPPHRHTQTPTPPPHPPHPPCCPSFARPGRTAGLWSVSSCLCPTSSSSAPSTETRSLNRASFRAGICWSGL